MTSFYIAGHGSGSKYVWIQDNLTMEKVTYCVAKTYEIIEYLDQ